MMRLSSPLLLLVLADEKPPSDVPPAVPPKDARKTIQVAKGLDIELLAHEPMVRQPVNITFDDRGRLWVLEYLQYPIPNGLKAVEVDQYLRTKYDRRPRTAAEGAEGGRPHHHPRRPGRRRAATASRRTSSPG